MRNSRFLGGAFPTRRLLTAASPAASVATVAAALGRAGFRPSPINLTVEGSAWTAGAFEVGSTIKSGFVDILTDLVPFLIFYRRKRTSMPFTRVVVAARASGKNSEVIIAQVTSSAGSYADVEGLAHIAIEDAVACFHARGELFDSGKALRPQDVPRDCPAHIWEFKRLAKR